MTEDKSDKTEQSGEAFKNAQKATDRAINERIKEEEQVDKLDPSKVKNRDRQVDTPQKKTGGGKQKGPGM